MSLLPRFRADRLWRRLAEAQDVAAANGLSPADVARGAARVIAARADAQRAHRGRRVGIITLSLGTAVAAVAVFTFRAPILTTVGTTVGLNAISGVASPITEQTLVADARSDLPLTFADGSTVTFLAGSTGRMKRLVGTGADVVLEQGSLEAHVVHGATTLWLVHAGPYRVRVTGTRFAVKWASGDLEVALHEGAVLVDGAVLGAGVPVRAGQRLRIASRVVVIEPFNALARTVPLTSQPASGPSGAVESPDGQQPPTVAPDSMGAPPSVSVASGGGQAVSSRVSRAFHRQGSADDEWLALAERGAYSEALTAARRLGWGALCRRLDANRLLTLGDVARYSGAHVQARRAFEALVSRFPKDRLAADAVFSLGRLAFESRRPDEATRWFRRYVADWPRGPLADQAAGRLVECAIRMDDRDAARSAARGYLTRAPRGPQAGLAREVLEQPADGPP